MIMPQEGHVDFRSLRLNSSDVPRSLSLDDCRRPDRGSFSRPHYPGAG